MCYNTDMEQMLEKAYICIDLKSFYASVECADRGLDPLDANLVVAESDVFVEGVSEEDSWHARKQAAIDRLAAAPHDAKIVAMGDKLSNMRAIARDYAMKGDALWNFFHAKDPKDHEWHYRGLAASLSELKDTFAYKEFVSLIDQVFVH